MGRRGRKRQREGGTEPPAPTTTTDYQGAGDSVLTLRDHLSEGALRKLAARDARPAASAEDRWQRRMEHLFELLAARWEISGLPVDGQKELLGRYRMASAEERRDVRRALEEHLRARYPEVEL